mmetsp:Transcript_61474/g.150453  ORF Transcript_61474/g.150453 Transcript_61474/m.150453 type:complete len:650 (-) Transcript_61474:104-2053(-)|eukprot:CAMPEP_0113474226 /NCGR_PEP_ID=MMETSP0014_2-20120614/18468_1 /TAXON_ID=2857 /ORGANISM="Nitzschia sp." /LENGTH=649 /DNA_ID=CAMNT_0000367053 /DNA_START=260 /DNA_END=2209 /DNA_ORIENTATION=- /assembly_acc=CAM_ASM_000159
MKFSHNCLFLAVLLSATVGSTTTTTTTISLVSAAAPADVSGGEEPTCAADPNSPTCTTTTTTTTATDAENKDSTAKDDDFSESSSSEKTTKKPPIDWDAFTMYADRHAMRLESLKGDYDCMEREFDFSDPDFDFEEAAYVYDKCRLLVLRNVYDIKYMEEYRTEYDKYLYGIHTGQIDRHNTPTNDLNANDIVQWRGKGRHDIMLPKYLSRKEIAYNDKVMNLVSNDLMIGPDVHAHQVGSVIAEKGCDPMYWHEDQTYLYGQESFNHAGIGGHDLLPYVINLFVPLGNVTAASGPTEFCMGATHLAGMPADLTDIFYDTKYEDADSDFRRMHRFQYDLDACPPEFWRRPLIGAGDAVLFDYHLTHRGGPNTSDELRALLYVIYARAWFRDLNFDSKRDDDEEEIEDEEWAAGLRYTLVEEAEVSKQLRTLQRVTQQFHDEHEHSHDDKDDDAATDGMDAEEFVKHTISNVQAFAGIGATPKPIDPYETAAKEPGKVTAVNVEIVDTTNGEKQETYLTEDQLKKLQEESLKKAEESLKKAAEGAGAAATPEMVMPPTGNEKGGVSWEDFEKYHMPKAKSVTFPLTNINGVGSLWIEDRKQLAELEPYEQWDVTARVGETLSVRDQQDESVVLHEWTIVKGQRQIVYSVP